MSSASETAALVVAKARDNAVSEADAISFATVEIGNLLSAELESAAQAQQAKTITVQAEIAASVQASLAKLNA